MVIKAQQNTLLARPRLVTTTPKRPVQAPPKDSFQESAVDSDLLKMQALRRMALRPSLAKADQELSNRVRAVEGGTDEQVQTRELAIEQQLEKDLATLQSHTDTRLKSLRDHRQRAQQNLSLGRSRASVLGTQGSAALEALLKRPGGAELVTNLDTLATLTESGQANSPQAEKLRTSLRSLGIEFPDAEGLKAASEKEKNRIQSYRGVMKEGYAEKQAGRGTDQELVERFLSYREGNKDSAIDYTKQAQSTQEYLRKSEQEERELLAKTASEKEQLRSKAAKSKSRVKESTLKNLKRRLNSSLKIWDLNPALKNSEALSGTSGLDYTKSENGLKASNRGQSVVVESQPEGHKIVHTNTNLKTRTEGTVDNEGREETEVRRYQSERGLQKEDPQDLAETRHINRRADGSRDTVVSTYKDGKIERSIEEKHQNGKLLSRRDTRVVNDWNTRGISSESTTHTPEGTERVKEWAHETTSGRAKGMTHWGRTEERGDTQVARHQFRHTDGTVNTSVEIREKSQLLSKRSLSERPNGSRTETLERLRQDGKTSIRQTTMVKGKVTERMSATKDAKGKILHSIKVRPWTPEEVNKDVAGTVLDRLSDHPQDLMNHLDKATGEMTQNKQVMEVFDGKTTRKSYTSTWTKGNRTLVKTVGLDKYGMPNGTPVWKLQIQGEDGSRTEQTFYQGSEDTVVSRTKRQGQWEVTDSTIQPHRHLKNGFGPEHKDRARRMTTARAQGMTARDITRSQKMLGVARQAGVAEFLAKNGEAYQVEVNKDYAPDGLIVTKTQWVIVAADGQRLTLSRDPESGQFSQAKVDSKLKEQAQARSLVELPGIKKTKDRGLLSAATELGRGPANILEGAETIKLLRKTAPHFLRKAKMGRIAATSRGGISALDLMSGNPVQALTGAGVMLQTGMEVKDNVRKARAAARVARGLPAAGPASRTVRTLGFAGAALSGATGVHKFITSDNTIGKTSGALDALGGLSEGLGFFLGSGALSGLGIAMAAGALYFDRGEQIQIGDIQI